MMHQQQRFTARMSFSNLVLFLLLSTTTSAFSVSKFHRSIRVVSTPSTSSLNVASFDNDPTTEGNVLWINRAIHCANSESCDLEEAETCLEELSHIKMIDLASEKATAVSEVVASLRRKIEDGDSQLQSEIKAISPFQATMGAMNVVAGVYVACALLHDFSAGASIPLDDSVLSCFETYTML